MNDVEQYNLGRSDAMGVAGTLAECMLATCNDMIDGTVRYERDSYWGGVYDQLTNDTRALTPVCPA